MFTNEDIKKYTSGNCNIFAIALHDLNPKLKIQTKYALDDNFNEIVCHSWCLDDKGFMIDINGDSYNRFYDALCMSDYNENEIIDDCNYFFLRNYYDDGNSTILGGRESSINWITLNFGDPKILIEEAKFLILRNTDFSNKYCFS